MTLNAADRKSVRAAEKQAAIDERERGLVIQTLASTASGRQYLWDKLSEAHIFASTYNDQPERMAFSEGQRALGLSLLNDIIQWCPEQFIQAMREHNERSSSAGRSAATDRSSSGERGSGEDARGGDQGSAGDSASGDTGPSEGEDVRSSRDYN